MFYGIIVLMYYFDNRRHHQPHIQRSVQRGGGNHLNPGWQCYWRLSSSC